MRASTFWKTVTMDHSNLLENLIKLLKKHEIRFCVIGGQAVNAYAEPLVSLDLDLADIARILENYSQYRSQVPQEIIRRLLE